MITILKILEILLSITILTTFLLSFKKHSNPFLYLGIISGIYLKNILVVNIIIILITMFITIITYTKYPKTSLLCLFFCFGTLSITINEKKTDLLEKMLIGEKHNINATVVDRLDRGKKEQLVLFLEKPYKCNIVCYLKEKTGLNIDSKINIEKLTFPKRINSDFKKYLIKEGCIYATFPKHFKFNTYYEPWFSAKRFIYNLRKTIKDRIAQKLELKSAKLFSCIFLGEKQNLQKEPFYFWGISHYLARSGLHMALLALAWQALLNFIPVSFYLKNTFLLLFCIIYALLSWSSISFLRAFILFTLFCVGKILHKQVNLLYLLTLVCISVVAFNPMQVFFLDFQLSFGLTFALLFMASHSYVEVPYETRTKKLSTIS